MDKGYDARHIYEGCEDRDVRPVIPPTCEHGAWTFAGADYSRKATKWRCPTGECAPASVWIKAERMFPLIPRETLRWTALYRRRAAVEREFGRLKHEWALAPLRVRGLDRVRLHAGLTILAKLACTLVRARAVRLAA
jgi:transposase